MPQGMSHVRAHPASVPDADSIPATQFNKQQRHSMKLGGVVVCWWSRRESPLQGAVALARATRSRGATRALRNPALIPRPYRTRIRFPPIRNQQTTTPPDEAGWRCCLLVEPGGIEPPSASPLQADLHT